MNTELLGPWADHPGDQVEEGLIDVVMQHLADSCAQFAIKPAQSVVLDVCAGYGIPALVLDLDTFHYHGLDPDPQRARLFTALRINNAVMEVRALEDVLGAAVKEPVAAIIASPPADLLLRERLLLPLGSYQNGERSAAVVLADWIANQIGRARAVVGAIFLPLDHPLLPETVGYGRVVEGRRQRLYLWTTPKTIGLTHRLTADLAWSAWGWHNVRTSVTGTGGLVRKGDALVPTFATQDQLLQTLCHVYETTDHLDNWEDRLNYRTGSLNLSRLMRVGDAGAVAETIEANLGQALPIEQGAARHLQRMMVKYGRLCAHYPDNGDQSARYWLLTQDQEVHRSDGTKLRVAAYQPSTTIGTPPSIALEPLNR